MKVYRVPKDWQPQKPAKPVTRSGVVQRFDVFEGRGIISLSSGENVHFSQSDIVEKGCQSLQRGQFVNFLVVNNKGRLRAKNVHTAPRKFATSESTSTAKHRPKSIPHTPEVGPYRKATDLPRVVHQALPELRITSPAPLPEYVSQLSPLMLAVKADDLQQVKLLLQQGHNPNAVEQHGCTALMFAVRRYDVAKTHEKKHKVAELIVELLNAGANPKIRAYTGERAIDLADDRKQRTFVNLLHEAARHHEEFPFEYERFLFALVKDRISAPAFIDGEESDLESVFDNFCEERWESSEGLAYMRRDSGQFGSFPLHDDYSDEGQTDSPKDNERYDR